MSRDDWHRNTEWSPDIEARFNEKLRRARDKFQPLRVQAYYLAEQYPKVALMLLERYFQSGDHFDKATAYVHQAQAFLSLGEKRKAITALQLALKREREFPNVKTTAWSEFALLVATEREESLYTDVLSVLSQQKPSDLVFPVDRFKWFLAHALICDALGEKDMARNSAFKALEWSNLKHSGFRYHPNLGLVGSEYDAMKEKLRQIASR